MQNIDRLHVHAAHVLQHPKTALTGKGKSFPIHIALTLLESGSLVTEIKTFYCPVSGGNWDLTDCRLPTADVCLRRCSEQPGFL